MKSAVVGFVVLLLGVATLLPVQAQNEDPYVFVKTVASATFERIKTDRALIDQDPATMNRIVEQELLPHIDHGYTALAILGNHANGLPKEKLVEYIEVFKAYLVGSYASSMALYQDQLVEFVPERTSEPRKLASIKALIKQPGKPDIEVDFKVRLTKDGQWKAYDLVAEGVSFLHSKRSEFTPIVRQQGIDTLISLLKQKSQPTA